jgi:hypothetical protein
MRTAPLVALTLGSFLVAGAAPPEPKATDKKPPADSAPAPFYLPKRLNLTDEQQEKLRDLRRAYGPKLRALELELSEALTPEQKKAAEQARQRALEDELKGREVREAVLETLAAQGVPASTRAKYRHAEATKAALLHEIHEKKMALLTQHQRDQLRVKPASPGGR